VNAAVFRLLPRLRPMRSPDLDAVHAIECDAYDYPWTRGIFGDCLRAGYSCWVIGREVEIEGYGIMSIAAGECHVLNLCVHSASRRRGLAWVLLEHLIGIARERNAEMCLLEVRPTNVGARALYDRGGFQEVGTRRNYYPDKRGREDAIILARAIQ